MEATQSGGDRQGVRRTSSRLAMVAARSGGDRQGVRRQGETRRNVVVLLRIGKPEESPGERTVMKFGSGRAREAIGR